MKISLDRVQKERYVINVYCEIVLNNATSSGAQDFQLYTSNTSTKAAAATPDSGEIVGAKKRFSIFSSFWDTINSQAGSTITFTAYCFLRGLRRLAVAPKSSSRGGFPNFDPQFGRLPNAPGF
jgi:hypothetical protein